MVSTKTPGFWAVKLAPIEYFKHVEGTHVHGTESRHPEEMNQSSNKRTSDGRMRNPGPELKKPLRTE